MKAYTQGEIDYFCAIYAIINSARFAAQAFHKFSFIESCRFYQHLMQYLYDRGELLNVLYHGTEYGLMDELLGAADKYLSEKYKIRLLWTHPFGGRDLSLTRAYLFIRKYLASSNASCIIRLNNRAVGDHWSVIEKLDSPFFSLFDSYAYKGMDFKKSIWDDGQESADLAATRISKRGIILVKVARI
jgi:hypothetical protein